MKKNKLNLLSLVLATMTITTILPTQAFAASTSKSTDDKIYFLPTKSSDAILIESNGRFGLVDAAEDTGTRRTDLPKNKFDAINTQGYEDVVVNFLKDKGVETLDFVIATHAHSDHIGGMDDVIKNFKVNKLYTRPYSDICVNSNGVNYFYFRDNREYDWDNKEVYNEMIYAAKKYGVNTVFIQENTSKKDLSFSFGDFDIKIVNDKIVTTNKNNMKTVDNLNSISLGVVVSKGDKRVFLGGDIDNSDGAEDRLISESETSKLLKNVDVYKIAHHGANGTDKFLKHLNPKTIIVTGIGLSNNVASTVNNLRTDGVYSTNDNGVIELTISDSGNITTNSTVNQLNTTRNDSNWKKNSNGTWSYYKNNNKVYGWNQLSYAGTMNWYCFNSKGEMLTGWQKLSWNGKTSWYYFDNSGAMKTGWQKIKYNGKDEWFYLEPNTISTSKGNLYKGEMTTGWRYIYYNGSNNWYYFDNNGVMKTGWQQINYKGKKQWFYFDSKGKMLTGKQTLSWNGKTSTYYFDTDGVLK